MSRKVPVSVDNLEIHLEVDRDEKAVNLLADATGLSKSRVKDAMTKGAVWLRKPGGKPTRVRRATSRPQSGSTLSLYYSARVLTAEPPSPIPVDIKRSYSVWHKPPGLMSSGTRYGDHFAIDRQVSLQLDRPAFIVHRLDQYVWGLMLLAHNKAASADLSRQFGDRNTRKIYHAVVQGTLLEPKEVTTPVDGKEAISQVRPVNTADGRTLVEITILTGRRHQIRSHLASIGHPCVGDRLHGDASSGDLQLASTSLGFTCPESGEYRQLHLPSTDYPRLNPDKPA